MTLVEQLAKLELVKIRFRLAFLEPFQFDPKMVLHWRKELLRGACRVQNPGKDTAALVAALLNPEPADDPYARKLFQKPAPPFIIDPVSLQSGAYAVGDCLSLEVLFPGAGVVNAIDFARILTGLGGIGFFKGEGRFALAGMQALTHNDDWKSVWEQSAPLENIQVPILNARWLLEDRFQVDQFLQLQFVTPARLLKKKRPLFSADFRDIVPYALRRVTSVLHACCRLELDLNVSVLLNEAEQAVIVNNDMTWVDWRLLDAEHGAQGIGGVFGRLQLDSILSEELLTVLRLAELFNIGKGASYGSGRLVLGPHTPSISKKH